MNGNDVRPFFVHLRAEHRTIRSAVAKLETALKDHLKDIDSRTRDLWEALDRHFCEEERDGCADEAVARTPALAHEATELCHEHDELLGHVDQLLGTVGQQRWRESFEELKRDLEAHLEREAHLLEVGLNADQDVETFE